MACTEFFWIGTLRKDSWLGVAPFFVLQQVHAQIGNRRRSLLLMVVGVRLVRCSYISCNVSGCFCHYRVADVCYISSHTATLTCTCSHRIIWQHC